MDSVLKQSIADELGVDALQLNPSIELNDLPNWDSVVALTLMVILSDHLGRSVSPDEISAIKTFGDIEAIAEGKNILAGTP